MPPASPTSPPESGCPCSSGLPYSACCGPVHEGVPAATAEALMRSRFTAFALGLRHHLLTTWHESTRPATLHLDDEIEWRRLQIVDTVDGQETDMTGTVEFRASFREGAGAGLLHERSRFARLRGLWTYVDGDVLET